MSRSKTPAVGAARKGGRYWVEAFAIGKYPITNAQYDVFIDDQDGYRELRLVGLFARGAAVARVIIPSRAALRLKAADLPCTNISWYEAVAFCRWLSSKTGLEIMLPTEQQWQRAAQGDDGREYPWGDEFDPSRCNFGNNVGRPTPVTKYALGASPYGVMNMSGNTWEWCLTEWGTDSTRLKGNGRARGARRLVGLLPESRAGGVAQLARSRPTAR